VKIGDVKAIEPLIQALRDPKASVRVGAAYTLDMIGDARAIKPLGEALEDDEKSVQREAATALTKIGGEEAEKAIAASGKFPVLVEEAKVNLMEKKRDVEGLIEFLIHKSSGIRMSTARSLDRLGWKPRNDAEKAHYLIAHQNWDELAKSGEKMVEQLIQTLKDEDSYIRRGAARALGEIGDIRAVEPLNQALNEDEDSVVKQEAFEALMKFEKRKIEKMEEKRDVEGLIMALHHENWIVRKETALALGRIGDARSIDSLTKAFARELVPPIKVALYEALEKTKACLKSSPP